MNFKNPKIMEKKEQKEILQEKELNLEELEQVIGGYKPPFYGEESKR